MNIKTEMIMWERENKLYF